MMIYTIRPGDTLLSIASDKTLSPAYATALMLVPENEGQADTITDDLTGRGVIVIPDNWVRTGAGASDKLPSWVPLAFIAAIIFAG